MLPVVNDTLADTANELLRLDPATVQERLRLFDADELDAVVSLTDNAATVNRLARIERGRRHEDRRGANLTPGVRSLDSDEMRKRSEEKTVAVWFDKQPTQPDAVVEDNGWKKLVGIARGKTAHVSHNSGDNEWYTPVKFIDSAVQVMGAIDVDPASSIRANATIGAATFYTQDDNGLNHSWTGRVFLNPPYAKGLVEKFVDKLIDEYLQDRCTEAVVVTNNATEVKWFQKLHIAQAICFPNQRIQFVKPDNNETATGLQGQTFHYLGGNADRFVTEFKQHGRTHLL